VGDAGADHNLPEIKRRGLGTGNGFDVIGSDIADGVDFLHQGSRQTGISAIITNPPYALAREFIERALHFDDLRVVTMLVRTDFDHAAPGAHLFRKEVVLTRRIRWFEDSTGSPSFNHCWLAYAHRIAKYPRARAWLGTRPPHVLARVPVRMPHAGSAEAAGERALTPRRAGGFAEGKCGPFPQITERLVRYSWRA
jgi:hypothetical protein